MTTQSEYYYKAEKMLRDYPLLSNEIKNLAIDIDNIENDYRGCGAITFEEKTGQTYKFNSSVENEVIDKEKKLQSMENNKKYKENQLQKIDNALKILNENEYEVIKLKFLTERRKSWANISLEMDRSEAWCRQLKDKAIKKIIPVLFVSELTIGILSEK